MAPQGFSNDVVAWSREHLKTFTRSGLILLPLESSCMHFPFHCNHLLLLKLDKYFLSPAVSPLCSSSQTISCNNQNICNNTFSHPKNTFCFLFFFFWHSFNSMVTVWRRAGAGKEIRADLPVPHLCQSCCSCFPVSPCTSCAQEIKSLRSPG